MSKKKKISIGSYAVAAAVLILAPMQLSPSRPCGVIEKYNERAQVETYLEKGGARPRLHCSAEWPTVAQMRVAAVPILRREGYGLLLVALSGGVVLYAFAQLLQGLVYLFLAFVPGMREAKHGV
jgi:hypothetical protein